MALTFDTHEAIRRLRGKGHAEAQAEGVVEFVRDATAELVTTDYLDRRFAEHRAEMYRALWIQGAGIVTINAAIIA
ncbi:MAG: hypothetical protein OXE43_04595, partial [Chloroflexi bacterium]|nr:hypothetical protein [Chloroflexota bacterium]